MMECAADRIKRLKMRAWRRGTKEMDLILGPFSDQRLEGLTGAEIALFDALLNENDHDLYQWVSGQTAPPDSYQNLMEKISNHAFKS